MNSIFEKHKWLKYVLFSFVVALGVAIIILACLQTGKVPVIINITLAVAAMILGLFLLITSLLSETHKLITLSYIFASILIALGIILLIARFGIGSTLNPLLIVYIPAVILLVFGVAAIIKAITLIVYREKKSYIVLMFLAATLSIVLGVLGLCFANKLISTSYIILGILLLVAGILGITFGAIADKKNTDK